MYLQYMYMYMTCLLILYKCFQWKANNVNLHVYAHNLNTVYFYNTAGKLYRTDFFPGLGWMLTVNL